MNSKPLGPRKGTIHVMCLVKNSLLGFGSSMALKSASFDPSDVGEVGVFASVLTIGLFNDPH